MRSGRSPIIGPIFSTTRAFHVDVIRDAQEIRSGVLALPYVGQRNDYQDALGAGLGVTEFAQEGRASEEVRELWRWVLKKLVEGSLDHEQHGKKAAC